MTKSEINSNEYHPYYSTYLDLVRDNTELIEGYRTGKKTMTDLINSIPEEKMSFRYQPEKWSINELIQHLIDTERVFMYRCFRIARNDKTELAGFEQDDFIKPSEADLKSKAEILEEFSINRDNSIALLKSLSEKNLAFIGNANGGDASARSIAFTVLGHDMHHTNIIKQRYL
ncbi:MAG: hypothetical protein ACI9SI_001128 [Polaribacter sp.]|jgi:hypothetical protein